MSELEVHKERIKKLAEAGKHDDAISQCNELLDKAPEWRADVLRLRAYSYALQGMYEEAIADRETLINNGEGKLRDYFLIAYNSLSAGRLEDASNWFKEVLRIGAEQNETWFESTSWLLLSFSQMQLGHLDEAEISVARAAAIEPDCSMPVHGKGMVTIQDIRGEIQRRMSRSGKG